MSIKIDKSVFTPDELNTYKALIAKATVDPEAGEDEMEKEMPGKGKRRPDIEVEFDDDHFDDDEIKGLDKSCKKSADPQLAAALNRLETLEKSLAMKEFSEIAKKYAPLGENEEELAKTLYEMKKSNEANYNAYIGILDKSLGLVEKSGIFAEIGKSAGGYSVAGGAVEKVEAIAADIMKSDTSISREHAIAKAWEDHPELVAEYDREYRR